MSPLEELVVTTKGNGDEKKPNKDTAAYNPGNNPDGKLLLPENPEANKAAEKKERSA